MCGIVANGDVSTENMGAGDNFERWQLGDNDSLGAVDSPLQSLSICNSAAGRPGWDTIHDNSFKR